MEAVAYMRSSLLCQTRITTEVLHPLNIDIMETLSKAQLEASGQALDLFVEGLHNLRRP